MDIWKTPHTCILQTYHTLRQRLVHPKEWTPKHKKSNLLYAIQCSEEYSELYKQATFTQEDGPTGEAIPQGQNQQYIFIKKKKRHF